VFFQITGPVGGYARERPKYEKWIGQSMGLLESGSVCDSGEHKIEWARRQRELGARIAGI